MKSTFHFEIEVVQKVELHEIKHRIKIDLKWPKSTNHMKSTLDKFTAKIAKNGPNLKLQALFRFIEMCQKWPKVAKNDQKVTKIDQKQPKSDQKWQLWPIWSKCTYIKDDHNWPIHRI